MFVIFSLSDMRLAGLDTLTFTIEAIDIMPSTGRH